MGKKALKIITRVCYRHYQHFTEETTEAEK
jgi:hypothetical protein